MTGTADDFCFLAEKPPERRAKIKTCVRFSVNYTSPAMGQDEGSKKPTANIVPSEHVAE